MNPAKQAKAIRVLICNRHTLFREGIKALLQSESVEIVGETRSARRGLHLAAQLRPDVVLMEASPADMTGPEATRRIKAILPKSRILIVSLADDELLASNCLSAGATGWIRKTGQPGYLRHLIGAA